LLAFSLIQLAMFKSFRSARPADIEFLVGKVDAKCFSFPSKFKTNSFGFSFAKTATDDHETLQVQQGFPNLHFPFISLFSLCGLFTFCSLLVF